MPFIAFPPSFSNGLSQVSVPLEALKLQSEMGTSCWCSVVPTAIKELCKLEC